MNEPHLFCWKGGVINLSYMLSSTIGNEGGAPVAHVHIAGQANSYVLRGERTVGEFMLMCARYHHFDRKEKWPDLAGRATGKPAREDARPPSAEVKTETLSGGETT